MGQHHLSGLPWAKTVCDCFVRDDRAAGQAGFPPDSAPAHRPFRDTLPETRVITLCEPVVLRKGGESGNQAGGQPGQSGGREPPQTPRLPATASRLSPDREWVWIVPTQTMLSVVPERTSLGGACPQPRPVLHLHARTAPTLPDQVPATTGRARLDGAAALYSVSPCPYSEAAAANQGHNPFRKAKRAYLYKSGEGSTTANPCALETFVPGRRTMQTRSI